MYLKSINLQNIHAIDFIQLSFIDQNSFAGIRPITVIIGENGTYKTTILECIALSSVTKDERIVLIKDPQKYLPRKTALPIGTLPTGTLPTEVVQNAGISDVFARIEAHFLIPPFSIDPQTYKQTQDNFVQEKVIFQVNPPDSQQIGTPATLDTIEEGPSSLTFENFYCYGLSRFIENTVIKGNYQSLMTRGHLFARAAPYAMNLLDFIDLRTFKGSRKETYCRSLAEFIQSFLHQLLQIPTSQIAVEIDDRFKIYIQPSDYDEVTSEQLSSGYQALLSILLDILNHAFIRNNLQWVNPESICGLVIIDELDLHLHPKWQSRILDIFHHIFPKVQWIVTTHSPTLLVGRKREEIIYLQLSHRKADTENTDLPTKRATYTSVEVNQDSLYAPGRLNIADIAVEYFGVTSQDRVTDLIRQYTQILENRKKHPNEAVFSAQEQEIRMQLESFQIDAKKIAQQWRG